MSGVSSRRSIRYLNVWPDSDAWPGAYKGAPYMADDTPRIDLDALLDGDETVLCVETLTDPTGNQYVRLWLGEGL